MRYFWLLVAVLLLPVSSNGQSIHAEEYLQHDRLMESEAAIATSVKALRTSALQKQSYGFHPYWASDTISKYYRWDLLSTLAYFGAEMNARTGEIAATNRWRTSTVLDSAKANGVNVHLTAILFSQHDSLLLFPARRAEAIDNLLSLAAERDADGINIDFEAVPGRLRDSLTVFVKELRTKAGSNFQLVIDLPAVDWNNSFDVEALDQYLDHFFLMAYDYHWRTGPTAGPVAPLDGTGLSIKNSVSRYKNKGINTSKIILGLPWYGFDWPTATEVKESTTLGAATSVTSAYAMQGVQDHIRRYDLISETPSYVYLENDTTHQVWYDDPQSLLVKYRYAMEQSFAGIGYWAISYAPKVEEMWNAIATVLETNDVAIAPSANPESIPDDAVILGIYDVTGRRITQNADVDDLPQGLYLVCYRREDRLFNVKLAR